MEDVDEVGAVRIGVVGAGSRVGVMGESCSVTPPP